MLIVTLLVLAALAGYLFFLWPSNTPFTTSPPSIILISPEAGQSAYAGSYLSVNATVSGSQPIARVELWLDGYLSDTVSSQVSDDQNPFSASFDLLMGEGPHLLSLRAVDANGIVGQTVPISIYGDPPLNAGEKFLTVNADGDQSLEDIGGLYDVAAADVQALNPNLGNGNLPPGTQVVLPNNGPSDQNQSQPPPAALQPGSGSPFTPPAQPPLPPANNFGLIISSILPAKVLPDAPSNLAVQLVDCNVQLRWTDNAENEKSHKVWIQGLGQPARVIATLNSSPNTGTAWFQFKAPPPGIYSIWVEAVNSMGEQASPVQGFAVPAGSQCGPGLANNLQLDVVDVTVDGGYTNFYCYISVEGNPEVRFPADDSQFVRIGGGHGKLDTLSASDKKYIFPIPEDLSLELQGECWGWIGTSDLQKIGSFTKSVQSEEWDGRQLVLTGSPFEIIVEIRLLGDLDAQDAHLYSYDDPTIPAPGPLRVDPIPTGNTNYPNTPLRLQWIWDPPPGFNRGTGFVIFLNGNPYKVVGINDRQAYVEAPGHCGGKTYHWQVAALAGEAQSFLSAPADYIQPKCQVFAEVQFLDIGFGEISDGVNFPVSFTHCDTIEAYYSFSVDATGYGKVERNFWGGNFFQPMTCGHKYSFAAMSGKFYNFEDTIIVPLSTVPGSSTAGITFGANVWDSDDWPNPDDLVANPSKTLLSPIEEWPGAMWDLHLFFMTDDGYGSLHVKVTGFKGAYSP